MLKVHKITKRQIKTQNLYSHQDFTGLLSALCTDFGCIAITGDLNVQDGHVNKLFGHFCET